VQVRCGQRGPVGGSELGAAEVKIALDPCAGQVDRARRVQATVEVSVVRHSDPLGAQHDTVRGRQASVGEGQAAGDLGAVELDDVRRLEGAIERGVGGVQIVGSERRRRFRFERRVLQREQRAHASVREVDRARGMKVVVEAEIAADVDRLSAQRVVTRCRPQLRRREADPTSNRCAFEVDGPARRKVIVEEQVVAHRRQAESQRIACGWRDVGGRP